MSAFEASSVIASGSELGVDFTNTIDFDGLQITKQIVFPVPSTTSVASYTRGGVDIHYTGTNDSFQITPNINSIMSEAGTGGGDTLRLAYTATAGLPANFIVSQNTGVGEATVNLQLYSESTTETWQTNLDAKGLTMMPSDINKYANGLTCVDGLTIQNSLGTVSLNAQNGLSVNKIFANDVYPLEMRSATTFFEQAEFNAYAPHCNTVPSTAEDLTNKSYVDSRLVNSGSGTNLYFNYSVPDVIVPYKQLGASIVITTQTTINTPQAGTQSIASFITDSGYPGTVSIPSGIWELNQFGRQVGGSGGILRYFFTLSKIDAVGTVSPLGTSGYSADINTSVTDIFFAQLPLGILTLLSTDRLVIEIFSLGTGTGVGHTLDSDFQAATYSYITTPLVSGSNFLSLNNVFTGSNSFTQPAVIPTGSFPQTTAAVNGAYLTANYVDNTLSQSINGVKTFIQSPIIPTGVFPRTTEAVNGSYVGANFVDQTNTQASIAGKKTFTTGIASNSIDAVANNSTCEICPVLTNGVLNIAKNCTGTVSLGNTGILNIGTGVRPVGKNISIGTGVGSVGTTNIGALTSVLTLYGGIGSVVNVSSGTLTFGPATCTSIQGKSGALAFGNDDTITNGVYIGALTKPTTIYGSVASNIDLTGGSINCGYLNGSTGSLSIGGLITTTSTQIGRALASTQLIGTCTAPTVAAAGDASDKISTTQWVNNFFGSVAGMFGAKAAANTWDLLQTFTSGIVSNAAIAGTTFTGTSFSGNGVASTFGVAGFGTTIRGNSITLSNPLTLSAVAPTVSTQLGWSVLSTTISIPGITNVSANIATITLPTLGGVYLISGSFTFSGTGTGVAFSYNIVGNAIQVVGNPVSSYAGATLPSLAYTSTSTNQLIYLRAVNNGLTNTVQSVMFSAVRIA